MTPVERAERLARIRAERAAAGRSPTIQTLTVYGLLAAVLDANQQERSRTK